MGDMMKKFDKTLFISVILLCLFGLLMVYSSSSIWADYKFGDSFHYLKYHSYNNPPFYFKLCFLLIKCILLNLLSKTTIIQYRKFFFYNPKKGYTSPIIISSIFYHKKPTSARKIAVTSLALCYW